MREISKMYQNSLAKKNKSKHCKIKCHVAKTTKTNHALSNIGFKINLNLNLKRNKEKKNQKEAERLKWNMN